MNRLRNLILFLLTRSFNLLLLIAIFNAHIYTIYRRPSRSLLWWRVFFQWLINFEIVYHLSLKGLTFLLEFSFFINSIIVLKSYTLSGANLVLLIHVYLPKINRTLTNIFLFKKLILAFSYWFLIRNLIIACNTRL